MQRHEHYVRYCCSEQPLTCNLFSRIRRSLTMQQHYDPQNECPWFPAIIIDILMPLPHLHVQKL